MIIGIAGKIGAGKDTVGKLMQKMIVEHVDEVWEIRKFASKLKMIASIITGVPIHYFEDQEFKNQEMEVEWDWNHELVKHDDQMIIARGRVQLEDRRKKYTYREFLQRLGTEAMRDGIHQDIWVNALFANYADDQKWIVTDMRFPNEYEAIEAAGGLLIKVDRTVSDSQHVSESALDNHKFKYVIDNTRDYDEEYLKSQIKDILILENII
jgi:hypothetical protein